MDVLYVAAAMGAVVTLHAAIVMPKTLEEARKMAREEMDVRMSLHEREIDGRMQALLGRLDGLATREGLAAVKEQLRSIDERLRHLERSGK